MITIIPTIFRIYEAITYDEICKTIGKIINTKEIYQFGALEYGGTINAINFLRNKTNIETKGYFISDIAFGYDSIDWNILQKFITTDTRLNEREKKLLLLWNKFNSNMDLWIANEIVKREIGIPMGCALSPVIFIYYVDRCLDNFKYKKDLVMYIDDLNLIINKNDNPKEKIELLKKYLHKGKLSLKNKKSYIITNNKEFFNALKKEYNITEQFLFLGRNLIFDDKIIQNDENLVIIDKNRIKKLPNWLQLSEKRLLFNGALEAKQRFIGYMMSITNIQYKKEHMTNCFNFYRNNFDKLSYTMLCYINTNMFRIYFDAIDTKEVYETYQKLEKRYIEISEDKYNITIGKETIAYIKITENKEKAYYYYSSLIITEKYKYEITAKRDKYINIKETNIKEMEIEILIDIIKTIKYKISNEDKTIIIFLTDKELINNIIQGEEETEFIKWNKFIKNCKYKEKLKILHIEETIQNTGLREVDELLLKAKELKINNYQMNKIQNNSKYEINIPTEEQNKINKDIKNLEKLIKSKLKTNIKDIDRILELVSTNK